MKRKKKAHAVATGARKKPSGQANELITLLMAEIAALLMSAGISSVEFQHIVKIGFVRAAERVARLGNARVNRSAVAAMTGLSRTEVRKLSVRPSQEIRARTRQRALRVIDGWQLDAAFLSPDGTPKPLNISSARSGFPALVRKYSGDIPPRTIQKELLRLELVAVEGQKISIKRTAPDLYAVQHLQVLSSALVPVLRGLQASRMDRTRLVGRGMSVTVPDEKAKRLLRKQVGETVQSFLTSLRSTAEGVSLPRKRNAHKALSTHVCVLISD